MQLKMSKVQLQKRKKFETNIQQMTLVSSLLVKRIQNNLNYLLTQLRTLLLYEGKRKKRKKSFVRLLQYQMHQITEHQVTQMIPRLSFTVMKFLQTPNENQNARRKRVRRKRIKIILCQVLQRLQNQRNRLPKHPKRNSLFLWRPSMNLRTS